MSKQTIFTIVLFITAFFNAFAQSDPASGADTTEVAKPWKTGGDLGLDFNQILFINPRLGSGDDRIAFGGMANFFAHYKKNKFIWENTLKLQYALQRLGSDGTANPFEKTIDIFRLSSKAGRQIFNDKTFLALDGLFESLISQTYPGNTLKPKEAGDMPIAEFMSPATIVLALGIDHKPNENLSLFLSPVAFKTILVLDDSIAQLGVHGNEPVDRDDLSRGYKNSFSQLGATFKAIYNNKFAKDRILCSSELNLFSNYLYQPENIDVYWNLDLGFVIFKNLSINVVTNLYYDHDILIPADRNNDGMIDAGEGGPRTTFVEALIIKYNYTF